MSDQLCGCKAPLYKSEAKQCPNCKKNRCKECMGNWWAGDSCDICVGELIDKHEQGNDNE